MSKVEATAPATRSSSGEAMLPPEWSREHSMIIVKLVVVYVVALEEGQV